MFLILVYVISVIAWGIVLFDMIRATYESIKYKTETPRLLVPLAIASLALFVESTYFLIANIVRYFQDDDLYMAFLGQDNLFAIKIFIAISGVLMLLKLRSEKVKLRIKKKGK